MTTELVKAEPVPLTPPLPLHKGKAMAEAVEAYRHLQHDLDKAMPEAIIQITGRPFRRKPYWRAVRAAFMLTVECVKEERLILDEDHGWTVTYRATAPNGASADGDGCCMASEKSGKQGTEHNIRSHAHTRGMNRAISNLVGFGEVSAEEMIEDEDRAAPRPTPKAAPKPRVSVTDPRFPERRSDDDHKVGSALISEAQQKRLFAISQAKGWNRADVQALLGRHGYIRSNEITKADYEAVCAVLEAGPDAGADAPGPDFLVAAWSMSAHARPRDAQRGGALDGPDGRSRPGRRAAARSGPVADLRSAPASVPRSSPTNAPARCGSRSPALAEGGQAPAISIGAVLTTLKDFHLLEVAGGPAFVAVAARWPRPYHAECGGADGDAPPHARAVPLGELCDDAHAGHAPGLSRPGRRRARAARRGPDHDRCHARPSRLMTDGELARLPDPPYLMPRYLVKETLAVLVSPSGHGKTFVALGPGAVARHRADLPGPGDACPGAGRLHPGRRPRRLPPPDCRLEARP